MRPATPGKLRLSLRSSGLFLVLTQTSDHCSVVSSILEVRPAQPTLRLGENRGQGPKVLRCKRVALHLFSPFVGAKASGSQLEHRSTSDRCHPLLWDLGQELSTSALSF